MAAQQKKAPASKPAAKKQQNRKPVERVRATSQAWVDPHSGVEVMLAGGVPPSGARIVGADGEPVSEPLRGDGEYYAVID